MKINYAELVKNINSDENFIDFVAELAAAFEEKQTKDKNLAELTQKRMSVTEALREYAAKYCPNVNIKIRNNIVDEILTTLEDALDAKKNSTVTTSTKNPNGIAFKDLEDFFRSL